MAARNTGKNLASTVVGGVAGSLVGGLLVRAGIAPIPATLGVAAVGAVGAFTTTGVTRMASYGMAGAGLGQLGLTWLATVRNGGALDERFQAALNDPGERDRMLDALREARNALGFDDGDDRFEQDPAVIDAAA